MSYTIEVYHGKQKAERHLGIYALYVMFYPQLVAGPIERPQHLLHQFREKKELLYENVTEGLKLILLGLFKKIVIADRLGLFVNEVYNNAGEYKGLTLLTATIFFAFEIYCDFSGYSSIAIGCARVMGFDLMRNFNFPYLSRSMREFWQRWHISLSTWFRDYVYIAMGGNRVSKWKWFRNVFITFLISGFWHGANWTFVIWGALHGLYVLVGLWFHSLKWPKWKSYQIPGRAWADRIMVFLLAAFAWIFFRANSLDDAMVIIRSIADVGHYQLGQLSFRLVPEYKHSVYSLDIFLAWVWIVLLILSEVIFSVKKFSDLQKSVRWSIYIGSILAILLFGVYDNNEFIYFQF